MRRPSSWRNVPLLVALVVAACRGGPTPCTGHWGVEFGMTTSEAVSAICLRGDGAPVVTRVGMHDTEVVTLRRNAGLAGPRELVAEVHEGRVMVIRAILPQDDPRSRGPAVEADALFVVGRRKTDSGEIEYRRIARACSARAGELRLLEAALRQTD
jgi:hypothetical protein